MKKLVRFSLEGIDGNAFAVMGAWKNAAKAQGWSKEDIKEVLDKCMSGDYDNLILTISENSFQDEDEEDDLFGNEDLYDE